MKKEGSLKLILAILVVVLLCLISLGGIYVKDKNIMKNVLPEYLLGMDLDTDTIIKLEVAKDEEDTSKETTEENNNANSEESSNQNSEQNSEQNGQAENIYTENNYKKSKEIFEKRLKSANIKQYTTRFDSETGNIILEVPSDTDTTVLQNMFVVGKTEVKVSETNEVIINENNIKQITVGIDDSYKSYGIGSVVKLDIEFTKEAKNKFQEMKNNYVIPKDEQGNETENNIVISIDGSNICSMKESEFLEVAVNGTLPLRYGDYTTDTETLNTTLKEANNIKNIVENGSLPVKYSIKYTNDIHSNINKYGVISVFAVIFTVMFIYLVFKYKLKGILSAVTILGFGSLLLLIIRLTNTQMSISGFVSIGIMLILQFIYLIKLLSNEKITSKVFTEEIIEMSKMLIPAFIMSAVIAFGSVLEISCFGIVIFWGIITFEIFNNIITRAILTNVKSK